MTFGLKNTKSGKIFYTNNYCYTGSPMAKKKLKNKIRLNSTADTGYFYVTKKNPKVPGKLKLRKYDPRIRKHVEFVEGKI